MAQYTIYYTIKHEYNVIKCVIRGKKIYICNGQQVFEIIEATNLNLTYQLFNTFDYSLPSAYDTINSIKHLHFVFQYIVIPNSKY